MKNYLIGLQHGLNEVNRIVKPDGRVCLVVQDSRYKELHVNLQQVVIETMQAAGRPLSSQRDHAAPNPRFSKVKLTNGAHDPGTNIESLLVFG